MTAKFEAHLQSVTIAGITPMLIIVRGDTSEELAVGIEALINTTRQEDKTVETIHTIMFREQVSSDGKVTPVIDCYPEWRGKYGQFKFVSIYLNNDADVAAFEAQAGLSIDGLPLYESQAPLQRTGSRVHKCEIVVPTPFAVRRKKGKMVTIGDKTEYRWDLVEYVNEAYPRTLTEPVWWKTIVKEYRNHYAFKNQTEMLVNVLKAYIEQGKLAMDTPLETARAFMRQTHPTSQGERI